MDAPDDGSIWGFFKANVWSAVVTFLGVGGLLSYLQFWRERRKFRIAEKKDLYELIDDVKLKHLQESQNMMTVIEELQEQIYAQQEYIQTLRLTLIKHGIELPIMPKTLHRKNAESNQDS